MTAKITASADGTKVNIGTAAEDALQIDATAKTIAGTATYSFLLRDYADDAAAAAGGVPVGGIYRTASALKVRIA